MLKPTYSATKTSKLTLSSKRKTKVLIRLRGCAGWSVPLLLADMISTSFKYQQPGLVEEYQNYFRSIPFICRP